MNTQHRTFLFWLLYIVCVISGVAILTYFGIPQLALHYDHSYLTFVLFGLFVLAEMFSARQAWMISKENDIADQIGEWMKSNPIAFASIDKDELTLHSKTRTRLPEFTEIKVPPSVTDSHLRLLLSK